MIGSPFHFIFYRLLFPIIGKDFHQDNVAFKSSGNFMSTLTSLPSAALNLASSVPMAGGAGPAQPSVMLQNFAMPNQQQDEWCWAAVSIAFRNFYGRNADAMTQCQLARKILSNGNCCENMAGCNFPEDLQAALTAADVTAQVFAGPLSAQDITNQLQNNRAIGVRIAWSSTNAHFVSVFGIYDTLAQGIWVDVGDPEVGGGLGTTPLDALTSNYRSGGGVWTHTYLTA
ncbi:hypothetical protein C1W90_04665 [Burkholderia pseudomallei]|uniref:papain-like cysteine protease family protein n=1 Tax=Burkholderia pseudomallei TaxID=28450 RepID=UPI0013658BD5|nr:papain-like cysteine protease family protein [Burkholderia pseudomallei]NAX10196.1 hypothetical protein [Burkholderia pseudomallei]NAX98991.1 hypothetical protein [Burkholderia pseudomallei]NAY17624.1 hypothetical protein [Burkholderia pseudomallei]NAY24467.1 hypothetical protein [Burkholderia pseudomallei]NAY31398.1 hypothetical protein [Burkholderia pseudomallei]